MANSLSTTKRILSEQAIELYRGYGEDILLEKEEYKLHYSSLGEVLFEIESSKSFEELVSKVKLGKFNILGYYIDEEDMLLGLLKK